MKYFGCILEFTRLRNVDLMRAYRYQTTTMRRIQVKELGERIADMPSARFWVSEERAAVIISQLLKGRPALVNMRKPKREMFEEIFRRYKILQKKMPNTKPIEIVGMVVNSPAPKFYMAPKMITETIYKIKNGFYEKYCSRADSNRKYKAQ